MIDVALLGCGGSMPIPNRYLTSLLINCRGRKILIDCGEGTQVSMKMLGWGFKTIDVICLTHFHADHVVGLPGLLSTIGNSERTEPITIIGPIGLREVLNGLKVIFPYLPYELNIIEIDDEHDSIHFEELGLMISTLLLEHSSPCLGYRFDFLRKPKFDPVKALNNQVPKMIWNRLQKGETVCLDGKIYEPYMVLGKNREGIRLSYITDTLPIAGIADFVQKSDLFICEGMYGDNHDLNKAIHNKHMIFSEAAMLAKRSQVLELILTHFSPVMNEPEQYLEETKKIFPHTIIGFDRLTRSLNFLSEK